MREGLILGRRLRVGWIMGGFAHGDLALLRACSSYCVRNWSFASSRRTRRSHDCGSRYGLLYSCPSPIAAHASTAAAHMSRTAGRECMCCTMQTRCVEASSGPRRPIARRRRPPARAQRQGTPCSTPCAAAAGGAQHLSTSGRSSSQSPGTATVLSVIALSVFPPQSTELIPLEYLCA